MFFGHTVKYQSIFRKLFSRSDEDPIHYSLFPIP